MIKTDRDAWLCDLAETYHILDITGLSILTLATLSFGLREDSRIKMLLSDSNVQVDKLMMAMMIDRLSLIWWAKTKDGSKGINPPNMLVDKLMGTKNDEVNRFSSIEEFKSEWNRIAGGEIHE